jgi:hypothetical protein
MYKISRLSHRGHISKINIEQKYKLYCNII